MTLEFEETPEGTRVTEYIRHDPGLGQRIAFSMMLRMMAGQVTQSRESLRSLLSAAAGAPPGDEGLHGA